MPRKQVYGKRSAHVYSNFAGFVSPTKGRKQPETIQVLEVAEELGRLTVHDATNDKHEKADAKVRSPLSAADGNADRKSPRSPTHSTGKRVRKTVKKDKKESLVETATPEQQESSVVVSQPDQEESNITTSQLDQEESNITTPQQDQEPRQILSSEETITSPSPPSLSAHKLAPTSDAYTTYASPLLSLSSQPLASFDAWSDQLSKHFTVAKIAEASFGEVYRLSLLKSHPSLGRSDESVLKIIALKAPPTSRKKMSKASKKRMEMMSDPEDVASEVRLMQRMTTIPGYTMFRECCVLQGRPGASFVSAWHDWNEAQKNKGKETSVFPDPAKKASYSEKQLWAVIEMQDAGTDLENVELKEIWATWDVYWGVVLALAKGEDDVGFEHRDLHMGNICVSKRSSQLDSKTVRIDPTKKLGFTGIETTLIDYTISRAQLSHATDESEEEVAFMDLEKDLTLFEGDAEEEYQYEMYRHMRAAMYLDDPLADLWERWDEVESSGRTWRGYHPQTNLIWLHFILYRLLEQLEWPSDQDQGSSGQDEATLEKAAHLERAFVTMQSLLDPYELPQSGLRSAGDLIRLALCEGWLGENDIQGTGPMPKGKGRRKARVGGGKRKHQ